MSKYEPETNLEVITFCDKILNFQDAGADKVRADAVYTFECKLWLSCKTFDDYLHVLIQTKGYRLPPKHPYVRAAQKLAIVPPQFERLREFF